MIKMWKKMIAICLSNLIAAKTRVCWGFYGVAFCTRLSASPTDRCLTKSIQGSQISYKINAIITPRLQVGGNTRVFVWSVVHPFNWCPNDFVRYFGVQWQIVTSLDHVTCFNTSIKVNECSLVLAREEE